MKISSKLSWLKPTRKERHSNQKGPTVVRETSSASGPTKNSEINEARASKKRKER